MKKIYISLLISMISVVLFAQQDPQFTQNMFNNLFTNSGYAGINKRICVTSLYRQQLVGFKSTLANGDEVKTNPQTTVISIDAPIRVLHGGIGVSLYSDKLGFENNIGVKIGYSFHLGIANGILGIGFQVGLLNKSIDFSKFNPIDPGDPLLEGYKDEKSTLVPDVNLGLFYNIPGKAYVGLSSTQLLQSSMNFDIGNDNIKSEAKLKRHYYLTGAYHWTIPSAPDWELSPYLFIKTDLTAAQYDITAMAKWQNMVWAGISYRVDDAVAIIVGAYPFNQPTMSPALQQLKIGYSYDVSISALGRNGRSSGAHEIMLGYCFKITTTPKITKYSNTRFL